MKSLESPAKRKVCFSPLFTLLLKHALSQIFPWVGFASVV